MTLDGGCVWYVDEEISEVMMVSDVDESLQSRATGVKQHSGVLGSYSWEGTI